MSDNPFAEPEDNNKTVVRPTPGKRRGQAPEQAAVARGEHPTQHDCDDNQAPTARLWLATARRRSPPGTPTGASMTSPAPWSDSRP